VRQIGIETGHRNNLKRVKNVWLQYRFPDNRFRDRSSPQIDNMSESATPLRRRFTRSSAAAGEHEVLAGVDNPQQLGRLQSVESQLSPISAESSAASPTAYSTADATTSLHDTTAKVEQMDRTLDQITQSLADKFGSVDVSQPLPQTALDESFEQLSAALPDSDPELIREIKKELADRDSDIDPVIAAAAAEATRQIDRHEAQAIADEAQALKMRVKQEAETEANREAARQEEWVKEASKQMDQFKVTARESARQQESTKQMDQVKDEADQIKRSTTAKNPRIGNDDYGYDSGDSDDEDDDEMGPGASDDSGIPDDVGADFQIGHSGILLYITLQNIKSNTTYLVMAASSAGLQDLHFITVHDTGPHLKRMFRDLATTIKAKKQVFQSHQDWGRIDNTRVAHVNLRTYFDDAHGAQIALLGNYCLIPLRKSFDRSNKWKLTKLMNPNLQLFQHLVHPYGRQKGFITAHAYAPESSFQYEAKKAAKPAKLDNAKKKAGKQSLRSFAAGPLQPFLSVMPPNIPQGSVGRSVHNKPGRIRKLSTKARSPTKNKKKATKKKKKTAKGKQKN
jgi:hypothetical protein